MLCPQRHFASQPRATWVVTPKCKNAPLENKYLLTLRVTTQVKVVKGLYTEVRNVQHVAWGRVSRVFVLIDRESFE